MWPIKLFLVLLRNQIILKPKARRATKVLVAELDSHSFALRSVDISLGFAEADDLSCDIIMKSDFELKRFNDSSLLDSMTLHFQQALLRVGYPVDSPSSITVNAHSEEEIKRSGGYYSYFNQQT